MQSLWKRTLALLLTGLLALPAAQAVTISYSAVDLPDLVAGEDLWQYNYQFTGPLEFFGGFNLLFDPAQYAMLQDPVIMPAELSALVTQPDNLLPADGILNITSLAPQVAGYSATFQVSFLRLGAALPVGQAFEVFDAGFSIIETGITTPVPEPAAALLLGAGLLLLCTLRRRPG